MILLQIYLAINIFILGLEAGNGDYKNEEGKILLVTWISAVLVFGALIYGGGIAWTLLERLCNYLERMFQIRFFFEFNFSKFYNNLSIETLNTLNRISCLKSDITYKNRRYKRCMDKINKRNNFIYVPAPKSEPEF